MFRFNLLTDFEKLQFTEDYIKELKVNIEEHKTLAKTAVKNLETFIADVRAMSKKGAKLMSYKQEMVGAHAKNRKLQLLNDKTEHKNYLLRVKIRVLEATIEEAKAITGFKHSQIK
jgi:hypothetical protein